MVGIVNKIIESLDEIRSLVPEILRDSTDKLLNRDDKNLLTHNFKLFFRGETDKERNCNASLFRKDKNGQDFYVKESEYLNIIFKKVQREFNDLHIFDKIAKVQHYGGRTRLLDFTEDVEIAAFFACSSQNINKDGIIYCCFADYYDFSNGNNKIVKDILANYCYNINSLKTIIDEHKLDKKLLIKLLGQDHFIKPLESNERIRRQKGQFLWMGDTGLLIEPVNNERLLEKKPSEPLRTKIADSRYSLYNGVISTIIIPSKTKGKILDKLRRKYGISKTYIYVKPEEIIKRINTAFCIK